MKKIIRRNFLKTIFLSLSVTTFIRFDLFSRYPKNLKLKKNKNFIWYLNDDD